MRIFSSMTKIDVFSVEFLSCKNQLKTTQTTLIFGGEKTFNKHLTVMITPGPYEISLRTHSTVKQSVKVRFM